MADDVELYIYRKRELETDHVPDGWEDPEGLMRVPRHHRVMWLTNPLSWGDEDPVRAYAVVGKRVAGYVALMAGEVRLRGEPVRVLWGFNLVVSPSFRGKGLAIKLVQAWQNAHHTAIGTHVNQISVGIYRKLGWVEFHYPCFTLIRRSRHFLAGYAPGPVAAVAAPIVDVGLAARRGLMELIRPGPRDLRVERVESMPVALDAALARPSATVVTHRSAAWFDWQNRARDAAEGIRYRLCLVRDRGEDPVGYFLVQLRRWPVLRERFRDVLLASVREWGVFAPDRVDHLALYLMASREGRDMGADAVHMTVADPAAQAGLKQRGYGEVQPLRTVFFAHPQSPLVGDELRDARAWRTTAAEADGLVI